MFKVVNDFYLDADDNCYVLIEWNGKTGKKNEMIGAYRRYFSDIEPLLLFIVKHTVRKRINKGELNSIQELIDETKAMKKYVKEIIGGRYI